jgi:hypothetical protein
MHDTFNERSQTWPHLRYTAESGFTPVKGTQGTAVVLLIKNDEFSRLDSKRGSADSAHENHSFFVFFFVACSHLYKVYFYKDRYFEYINEYSYYI